MPGRRKIYSTIFLVFILYTLSGGEEGVSWFKLKDLSGALILTYQSTREQETSLPDTLIFDNNRSYFKEGFQLNLTGSVYHPNLLSFDLNLNLLAHQSSSRNFSDEAVNNALNNTYKINLWVLKQKSLNFQFYTRRDFITADRAFLERYYNNSRSTGIWVISSGKFLPFRLNLYTSSIISESILFREREEESDNLDLELTLLSSGRTRSKVYVRGRDYSEAVYDISFRSWELRGNFLHNYGNRGKNRLFSSLNYHRMTGKYDLELLQVNGRLINYLSRNLFLTAGYAFSGDSSMGRSHQKHEISGRLNHQLFASLTSTLEFKGRLEDSRLQKRQAVSNNLTFNYRKKIPSGSIQISIINFLESGAYNSKRDVNEISEEFDFNLTEIIILPHQGIQADSILLTSPDLSRIYVNNVDYQVDVINNLVNITRIPGGAIPQGSSVLIRYRYLSLPDFNLSTHFYQVNLHLNVLKYLHLFYRKRVNNQDVRSEYVIPPFMEYDSDVYGAKIQASFINASYTRENYRSNLSDYTSENFRLAARLKLFKSLSLFTNVSINRLEYQQSDFFTHFNAYVLGCSFTPGGNFSLDGQYRRISYSTPNYNRNRETLLLKLKWAFRKIDINLFYEYILTGTDTNERMHNYFSILIRRLF